VEPIVPTNHPDTTKTSAESCTLADEQTAGCKIKPEEKKLGPATTSARIPAPQTKKPTGQMTMQKKRDMARMAEFLAKKRGQQTGHPAAGHRWNWSTGRSHPMSPTTLILAMMG